MPGCRLSHLPLCVTNVARWTLTGVAQWVGHPPANRKLAGSMPDLPGLWARSLVGGVGEAADQCFCHTSMFLSLSFCLPSPLSKISKQKSLKTNGARWVPFVLVASKKKVSLEAGQVVIPITVQQ